MIERSEVDSGRSVINRRVILPSQSGRQLRDDIDIANAIPNPQLLNADKNKVRATEIPIWETDRGLKYASSPGLDRYVILRYSPDEEGVKKYTPFDALDPLPFHLFKSKEEFEEAQRDYKSGKDPEKRIDVNIYNWQSDSASKASEIPVFSDQDKEVPQLELKAA